MPTNAREQRGSVRSGAPKGTGPADTLVFALLAATTGRGSTPLSLTTRGVALRSRAPQATQTASLRRALVERPRTSLGNTTHALGVRPSTEAPLKENTVRWSRQPHGDPLAPSSPSPTCHTSRPLPPSPRPLGRRLHWPLAGSLHGPSAPTPSGSHPLLSALPTPRCLAALGLHSLLAMALDVGQASSWYLWTVLPAHSLNTSLEPCLQTSPSGPSGLQ